MADTNRRTFLASMAAAFAATTLGIKPTFAAPPKIRYELFTDPCSFRYDLSSPWSKDGAIYATDSRCLITHPGEWSGDGTARVPPLSKLCWSEFDEPGWKELPPLRLELRNDHVDSYCHHCMGMGRVGDGVHRNPIYDDTEDSSPEWIGGVACQFCQGTTFDETFCHHERLGDAVFSPHYLQRFRTLGGLDYRLAELPDIGHPKWNPGPHHILLLRGDSGLRGMLMSMTE